MVTGILLFIVFLMCLSLIPSKKAATPTLDVGEPDLELDTLDTPINTTPTVYVEDSEPKTPSKLIPYNLDKKKTPRTKVSPEAIRLRQAMRNAEQIHDIAQADGMVAYGVLGILGMSDKAAATLAIGGGLLKVEAAYQELERAQQAYDESR